MTIRSRLATVLRARRAQEDIARGEVARANAALTEARSQADARAAALDDWSGPRGGDSTTYLASVAAGRALASALGAARQAEHHAKDDADTNADRLRAAAQRRRSVEKLTERALAVQRAEELAAQQRVLDDISATRHKGEPS